MSSGLAESGPPETNTPASRLELVAPAPEAQDQPTAEVIDFPLPEQTAPAEAQTAEAVLTSRLEKLYFEDNDMIAPELAALGVHIEDLTDGNDGLAIMVGYDLSDQLRLSQHLIFGYDQNEDCINGAQLDEKFYRLKPGDSVEEYELIGEKITDWRPGAEPDLPIMQAIEALSASIEQAGHDRRERLKKRTSGYIIEKARQSQRA